MKTFKQSFANVCSEMQDYYNSVEDIIYKTGLSVKDAEDMMNNLNKGIIEKDMLADFSDNIGRSIIGIVNETGLNEVDAKELMDDISQVFDSFKF